MGNNTEQSNSSNMAVLAIKKHPVIWFFVFAFVISWVTIFASPLLPGSFIEIPGVFAPAIAGMIVAACMNPTRSNASQKKRLALFITVFVACVCVFLFTAFMSSWHVPTSFYISYTITSLIAAYSFSSYYHPIQGIAQMYRGLNQKGKNLIWLLIAAVLPLIFAVTGALINLGLGTNYFQTISGAFILSLVLFIPNMFVFGGPSGEEPGWRAFATPQMQKYYNPLVVGLIIGIMWTIWHLPLYWTGDYTGGVEAAAIRFIWNTALGVLFAWVYNESNGNLLAALILHTSNNIIASLFAPGNYYMMWAVEIVFIAIVVIVTKFWRKTDKLPTITPQTSTS
jgi:uncharacterized protein